MGEILFDIQFCKVWGRGVFWAERGEEPLVLL